MGGIFNNKYGSSTFRENVGRSPLLIPNETSDRNRSTILPTVFKVSKDELEYWTNMTCFYDKQWEFNPKLSTVPISFFHITNVTEVTSAQGSEKRVIVYESPAAFGDGYDPKIAQSPATKNNLEVIMDNVIVHPKQYQMEVIIPDSLIGPYHRQGLRRLEAMVDYMEKTDSGSEKSNNAIIKSLQYAQIAIDTFDTAANVMNTLLGTWGNSSQMDRINKNSVDAMAASGHVVLFKKWTGYDYCYGIITRLEISKRPSEDGVYRGSLIFQETPILNISPKKTTKKGAAGIGEALEQFGDNMGYASMQVAKVLNLALALPFIKLTGVMDEAGAPGSDTADGGSKIML
jgi:hypothetical protein